MARKTTEVTVAVDGSRDKGKTFLITEMAASAGEDWALRAIRLAQRAGADVPGGLNAGMAGIAAIGILAVLEGADNIGELRPLFAEMMACVEIVSDPKSEFKRRLIEDGVNEDIEEIGTRVMLRKEWLDLHLDFSIADALSKLTSKTASAES